MSITMAGALVCVAMSAPADQDVVFRVDFNRPDSLATWTGSAARLVDGYEGTPSLLLTNTQAQGGAVRMAPLPADRLAGQLVTFSAVVKAEGVSHKPKHWNGIKVMLILETAHGKQHPQLPLPVGTFDWMAARRTIRVPKGVIKATLVVGLERVTGRAWFDNVVIRLGRPGPKGHRRETRFKGHDLARLRGVMHGPRFDEENIRVLARQWRANQVRWQLNWVPMREAAQWAKDTRAYDRWLDGALEHADKAVAACEKHGLRMLLDLHCPPGGRVDGGVCRLFHDKRYQDQFITVWDRIARRYKGREVIYAYDLVNEPVEGTVAPGLMDWRGLATKATRTIRAIDPGKPVVFEPGPWGGCAGFDTTPPLDLDRVIYSFHMYLPHRFTHQGVYGNPVGVMYPGVVGARMWNKETLREAMRPAIDFQRDYNVHIYVGEFSAIRWAPAGSAYRYLRDVIDLFEEHGWDWSYHAYREWDGWSVEHGPDPKNRKPTPTPTDRQKLLLGWFAKNPRPK